MKIVHVLNHFLPSQTAGTEVYTYALCDFLLKKDIISKVVIPNFGQTCSNSYNYKGVDVFQFPETSVVDRALIMGLREPDGLKPFGSYLEIENPDIVHFHELAGSNGITVNHVKLAKSMGFKVVITFHLARYSCMTATLIRNGINQCNGVIDELTCGVCYMKQKKMTCMSYTIAKCSKILKNAGVDFRKFNHPIGTLLGTANIIGKLKNDLVDLVNLCDEVVCLTNWYREILEKNVIDKGNITVIEQGLPFENKENPDLADYLEKKRPLKLMFLGRISKFKGLHLLLDALTDFPEEFVELSIYGNSEEGDYEYNLRNKTNKMSNVHWMGKLDQRFVIQTMKKHDLLCLCSTISEMSPLVIQEAKFAGIPVLASNVNGNSQQIIHDVTGLLFGFDSVNSLKYEINRLIKKPELITELKKNITKPRSFEDVGLEYLYLYRKVMDGAKIF